MRTSFNGIYGKGCNLLTGIFCRNASILFNEDHMYDFFVKNRTYFTTIQKTDTVLPYL